MRLKCEVHTTSRLLPTLNIHKPARTAYTQVSIGKNKDGQVLLMLCTAQNTNRTKYALYRNVARIFGKFVHEGKATVRLLSPEDDIAFSKADPKQLLAFLKLVRHACEGNDLPANYLSTLVPVSSEEIAKPITSLKVNSPSDYPMAFPKSLEELTINNCSLRKISPQIIALPNLKSLDMNLNCLLSVPDSLGQMTMIHTLNLSHNKLTTFPAILCKSRISKCLVNLDLSHNEIPSIPNSIINLGSLLTFKVTNNRLRRMPETLAFIRKLAKLDMSDNRIEYFPGTMLSNLYDIFEYNNNPISDKLVLYKRQKPMFPVPSLLELGARCVIKHKIPYTDEDLNWYSRSYVETEVHYCMCKKPVFEAKVTYLHSMKVPNLIFHYQRQAPFCILHFCNIPCHSRLGGRK